MTAALEAGEWSAACPGRTLPPGKSRYPFYRRLCEPHGRSGQAENFIPTGIRSRIVQPVVSCYTDWATRPTNNGCNNTNGNQFSCYCLSNIEELITGLPIRLENMLNFMKNFICPCARITTLKHMFYNSETNINKSFRYKPDLLPFRF